MNPGSNQLNKALKRMGKSTLIYYKYYGRTTNDVGDDVAQYLPGVELKGSLQPIARDVYYIYGYNLQKTYYQFFCSKDVLDLQRDSSGDQMAFNGEAFQCQSITAWYRIDGWVEVHLCGIGPDLEDRQIFGFGEVGVDNGNQNFEQGNFSHDGLLP